MLNFLCLRCILEHKNEVVKIKKEGGSYENCPTSKMFSFHLKTTIWSTTFGVQNIKQNSKTVTLEAYGATFLSFCSPHEQSVPI